MKDGAGTRDASNFLAAGGEMGRLVREKDWARTPLGAIETWPQSLRTTVSLCLASNFPINIIWGASHTQIYNDGYRVVCGDAHPRALGEDYSVTWASAWPAIGDPFARALAGETSFLENQRMFLTRNGYLEETFFTFSTSPVQDESGTIGGLFHPVTETTASMLSERRTRSLRDLNAVLGTATSHAEVMALAVKTLATFDYDLPFVLIYDLLPDGSYRLVARAGLDGESPAAPSVIDADTGPWPFRQVLNTRHIGLLEQVAARFGSASCGPYEEPPDRAFLLPILCPGAAAPVAIVVAGVSPRLPLNDAYRGYFELLAAALTAAAATVRAREQERRRAEALAELDRAKTAFFSNVSHEFRTPLTLMLGPLDDILADSEGLSTMVAGRLALVHRNGVRLLKLVNSLLDFSRIEAGRMQGHFEPTDVVALTTELASSFRSATERAGLHLIVDETAPERPVYVDHEMWEKVVLNLLSNAFKFTLAGEIRLSWQAARDGTALEMTISDTGTGIPAEELPRLFERFHRVANAGGRSFEGSGIGLALILELVKLHGGSIRVQSTVGEGSAFTVCLPFGTEHLPPQQIREAGARDDRSRTDAFLNEALSWLDEPDPDSGPGTDRTPREQLIAGRVLVADDNSDMRGYVVRILREAGLVVHAVADGQGALEAARASPFDLVLTDVMMPKINGFEVLRQIRADPSLREVSVILLSARAGEEARIEGLEAGADDYLIKPFAARELVARVAGAIGLARGRRASQEALREMQKMEALGRLTGGVAHDFNNLLMVISGGLDLVAKPGDAERRERIMQGMRLATQRGASLTRQLLAFSRRQSLQPQAIDLEGFLERAADMLDRTLSGDVAVKVQSEPGMAPVYADPAGLELALLNLCVNARDAMAKGGTILIRAAGAPGGVLLDVVDRGHGMTPDIAARAFEPFFTTKEIGAGSGLGLSQVYGFAQGSGGSVSISSIADCGTTVTLWLPQAPDSVPDEAKPRPVTAVPKHMTGTILLVEDDEEVAALTDEMLQRLGFQVTRVASAASALGALANGRKVDLVFSDILMPGGMNGVELACELRRRRPELPILLTSGYSADARFEAERNRMPVLPKPYTLDDLSEAIAETLDRVA